MKNETKILNSSAKAAGQNEPIVMCVWAQEYWADESINFQTDCGHLFYFDEGGPKYHEMKYCCFCGKIILEKEI